MRPALFSRMLLQASRAPDRDLRAYAVVDLRISSCTICLISARRARRQVMATRKKAASAKNAQTIAVWTETWVARNSTGILATELTAATIGLAKPKKLL